MEYCNQFLFKPGYLKQLVVMTLAAVALASVQANATSSCGTAQRFPYADQKLPFEDRSRPASCSTFNVKWDPTERDKCSGTSSLNSSSYEPLTPAEIKRKFGWEMPADMKQTGEVAAIIFDKFPQVRERVAKSCCGTDRICLDAINSVDLEFCMPPSSKEKGDPCFDTALYQLSTEKDAALARALEKQFDQSVLSQVGLSRNAVASWLTSRSSELQGFPYVGTVVVGTYYKKNKAGEVMPMIDETFLAHELGHACSSIRQQQHAFGKFSLSGAKPDSAFAGLLHVDNNNCKATDSTRQAWRKLVTNKDLFSCFQRLASIATGETPGDKCESADPVCESMYYEEAFAISSGFLNTKTLTVEQFAVDCKVDGRDFTHPRGGDVLDCLLQYDEKFRDEVQALVCNGAGSRSSGIESIQ